MSVSSTPTLASWDPMELFQLVNPDKMSITCVGYAPFCRRRCRNPIAYHNVQAAKEMMRQVVRPGVNEADLKEMLYDLAEYTLCRRYHQNQAMSVSDRWIEMVQRHRDDNDGRGSDTSDDDDGDSDDGASSTTSSSDDRNDDNDDDGIPPPSGTDNAQELRRRFDELESLQREFEGLLQRQQKSLQDRVVRSTLISQTRQPQENRRPGSELNLSNTTRERRGRGEILRNAEQARQEADSLVAQRTREAVCEQFHFERAERAKCQEAQRQAQRETEAKAKAQPEAKAKAKAQAEAERLRKEEEQAEKARLAPERQAKEKQQQQQSRILSWETAWLRYEGAWSEITRINTHVDTDIRTSQIWLTKTGSFESCCEGDLRAFFRCQPGDSSRRILRRQALRWHPDRAARLFACIADKLVVMELLKTVTMISQAVMGVMGVAKQ